MIWLERTFIAIMTILMVWVVAISAYGTIRKPMVIEQSEIERCRGCCEAGGMRLPVKLVPER